MQSVFGQIQLFDFPVSQMMLIVLIFVWSGFVRSGLGFGGAALTMPLLLLIDDRPLFWLPILCLHLLVFTSLTLRTRLENVDWGILKNTFGYILPGKMVGVFGLLSMPNHWLITIIYGITLLYAVLWVFDWRIQSEKGWTDKLLLITGGYFSGTTLMGAPVMVAVYMHLIEKARLRDTLFVLWFLLVAIKLITLIAFGVDLQFSSAMILVPLAGLGHIGGLKAHQYILKNDQLFRRIFGVILIGISTIGLGSLIRGS